MIKSKNDRKRYQTVFTDGTHQAVSDTTEKNGGNNAGFRPHDLLEAALASCVNIWIRMYADNHSIPLTEVTVSVSLDRSGTEAVTFKYAVDLAGELTDDQHRKLLQVAKTCPVRQTLSKPITFRHKTPHE